MTRLALAMAAAGCALAIPSSNTGVDYLLDDGSGELNIGLERYPPTTGLGTLAWMNQFEVEEGGEVITEVLVAFGPSHLNSGIPVDIYLWSDPNNDADPSDALVLAHVSGMTAHQNSNTFNIYNIPDTYVGGEGTVFFVGVVASVQVSDATPPHTEADYIMRLDSSSIQARTWVFAEFEGTGLDPDDLLGSEGAVMQQFGYNAMVRAVGEPEP
jgi:hypothetical protein